MLESASNFPGNELTGDDYLFGDTFDSGGYDFKFRSRNYSLEKKYAEDLGVIELSPEKPKTEVPVFLSPGFLNSGNQYMNNLESLAKRGRRALSINNPHGIDHKIESDLPDTILRKIAAIIDTMNEKDIEKMDAIGHSAGCITIVLAASIYPEKFRNLVLVNPAGLLRNESMTRLSVSFSINIVQGFIESIRRGEFQKLLKKTGGNRGALLKNPIESIKHFFAISNSDIIDQLGNLKREHNLGISIINTSEDTVFPVSKMKKDIPRENYDDFYTRPGNHGAVYSGDNEIYTGLADRAISRLEKQSIK